MIKRILKSTLLFFTILFVTGVTAYLALTYFIRNEDSVVVPELVGKEVVQVLETLSALSLNTKVSGSEYSSLIPRNHVIYQDPEPGTIIKKNRDVRIVFSKGTMHVFAPVLVRQPLPEGEQLLSENGLKPGVLSYVYHSEIPKNTIISQYPEQGSDLERGQPVDLLVSLGKRPQSLMMKDLSGMSIDDAILYIEKNHLNVGTIKSVSAPKATLNTVTVQTPLPGSRIFEGATVDLSINRKSRDGKPKVYQADAGTRLFRYTLSYGFLKKHVRAQISCSGSIYEVYNDVAGPGEEIWVMVPVNTEATVFLYEDDVLAKTQFFE
jgi:eukaryotic-like serine/threonine-protein kinase